MLPNTSYVFNACVRFCLRWADLVIPILALLPLG